MAKKEVIINSNFDYKTKVYALILCISRDMESNTNQILREFDLSVLQLDILHELHLVEDGLTVSQIKDKMISDSPNVSRSLNKLMDNGLVKKQRNLKDQRVVKVMITQKGKDAHRNADEKRLLQRANDNLTTQEYEELYNLLIKL